MASINKKSLIFKILIIGIIGYTGIQSFMYKKSVLSNPHNTIAEIIGFENCYKHGVCLKYQYSFEGKTYTNTVNSTKSFLSWCKDKDGCVSLKFDITINKDKPEKSVADWDDIFGNKNVY